MQHVLCQLRVSLQNAQANSLPPIVVRYWRIRIAAACFSIQRLWQRKKVMNLHRYNLHQLAVVSAFLFCGLSFVPQLYSEDWPQWRGPNRDGVWQVTGVMQSLPEGQLPITWSQELGPGYSGPTVAQGLVYVMDRQKEKGTERVLCFNSTSGELVWKHEYECRYQRIGYEAGPRASVTIDNNRAYAVGSMGNFFCLDAQTGAVVWSRDLKADYQIEMPIWGIAASPLIYKNLVIQQVAGSDGACMVAFDKQNGTEVWRALNDRAGYSSPIVIQQANQDVLVCWTGDSLSGLDPATGKVHWGHVMRPRNMPIGICTPVIDGEQLFVSSFYDGSLMVQVPHDQLTSKELWRAVGRDEQNTKSLHAMIGTPILTQGHIYGVDSYGEFRCLNSSNGERIWEDLLAVPKARWSTIHMVRQANTDRVWMFNERGELLICKLSPNGLEIVDRCQLIEPTTAQLGQRGGVCWTHPAFAEQSIFIRNDKRLIKASLKDNAVVR
jgi:outer membrane protein assembly factor BamB